MADEGQTQGQPQIDVSQIQTVVADSVRATMGEIAQHAQQVAQQQQQAQQGQPDPVAQLLQPHLEPRFNALSLQQQVTQDLALFYATHPEAAAKQGEIERVANGWASQGKFMPRADIYQYMQGSPEYQAELEQKAIEKYQASLQKAQGAQTVGAGSPGRSMTTDNVPAWQLPPDQLKAALEGHVF